VTRDLLRRVRLPILVAAGGVLATLAVGAAAIGIAGADPIEVYSRLVRETLFSPYGLGQTIFKATPLIFTGLAVAIPFRAGLFNIGAEGQLTLGAFAAAWVTVALGSLPGAVLVVLAALSAFAAGALYGGIAGVMKSRFGAHEVITTIMLNFIAAAVTGYFVTYHFAVPETIHTPDIPRGAWLPRLSDFLPALAGSPANLALALALVSVAGAAWFLRGTQLGYEIRAVGLGPRAAEAGGIVPGRVHTLALAIGGGAAGLVGVHEVLGYRHYFQTGFSDGVGFMGIAVALLGRNDPFGVLLAAVLFGALNHGGLAVSDLVPKEIIGVLQGVVILMVLAGRYASRRAHLAGGQSARVEGA
jgi:simple sugar transport system permease protein